MSSPHSRAHASLGSWVVRTPRSWALLLRGQALGGGGLAVLPLSRRPVRAAGGFSPLGQTLQWGNKCVFFEIVLTFQGPLRFR